MPAASSWVASYQRWRLTIDASYWASSCVLHETGAQAPVFYLQLADVLIPRIGTISGTKSGLQFYRPLRITCIWKWPAWQLTAKCVEAIAATRTCAGVPSTKATTSYSNRRNIRH
jgi:hypothetical protein